MFLVDYKIVARFLVAFGGSSFTRLPGTVGVPSNMLVCSILELSSVVLGD